MKGKAQSRGDLIGRIGDGEEQTGPKCIRSPGRFQLGGSSTHWRRRGMRTRGRKMKKKRFRNLRAGGNDPIRAIIWLPKEGQKLVAARGARAKKSKGGRSSGRQRQQGINLCIWRVETTALAHIVLKRVQQTRGERGFILSTGGVVDGARTYCQIRGVQKVGGDREETRRPDFLEMPICAGENGPK